MPAHTHCRICARALPGPILDLGPMPLANSFLASPQEFAGEAAYPLAVTACDGCGLAQLTFTVPAEQLYRHYLYVSATSDAVRAHAERLADDLIARYRWGRSDLIVEVASNDGTVLKAFQARGLPVLGVEPARNVAAMAEAAGVPTVPEFFTAANAETVVARGGHAAGILARHVFAHVDDVHDFLRGVGVLLRDDGVLVIEVPYYGVLVQNLEFDTVYHEHLSYFALTPLTQLFASHGLEVVDVERVSLHGGSMILHVARRGRRPVQARVPAMVDEERASGLNDPSTLRRLAASVRQWKGEFERFVEGLVSSGATLVGYGAAAKGNTLLNYCPGAARALVCVLDRSPLKQGLYTPGTHVPVAAAEEWASHPASHMLILAWNFKDEIIRQMAPFAQQGGRFVVPIPQPHVV